MKSLEKEREPLEYIAQHNDTRTSTHGRGKKLRSIQKNTQEAREREASESEYKG